MAAHSSPPERVGFIGLGNMGAPMARRLASAGYRLAVADANAETLEQFLAETAAEVPPDPGTLGNMCGTVITMLPDGDTVREVLIGENGIVTGMQPGTLVVDMSSSSPLGTRELEAYLRRTGVALVDAPVSGGVRKAVSGTLAIMAGGEAGAIDRARPMLEAMGTVFTAGGSGCGHAMKALNNVLSAGTLALSAEAVIAGTRFGLDPAVMIEIINASTGRSNSTEHKFPAFVLPRKFDSGFALGLMAKDLRLAMALARATDSPAALMSGVSEMWNSAEQMLGFAADNTEVVRYLEAQAGSGNRG
jgi:3-hydroxyisobutyrate dehydrogenase